MSTTKLKDLPDQEYELLEEGDYEITPIKFEKKRGEGKEHSYLNVEYKITSGQNKGKPVWDIVSFAPKALWKLKGMLTAFGVAEEQDLPIEESNGRTIVDESSLAPLVEELTRGRSCRAAIGVEHVTPEQKVKGWKDKNRITEYKVEDERGVDSPWNE